MNKLADQNFLDVGRRDLEPAIAALLDRKALKPGTPAYRPKSDAEMIAVLTRFLADRAPGSIIKGLRRLGGGASKEQFVFDLYGHGHRRRCVLRMDPLGSAVETDRLREFEVLEAMQGIVPAPRPLWVETDGEQLGAPALIMEFANGVTKPCDLGSGGNVSGLGILLGPEWRAALGPQFLEQIVAIHGFDWRSSNLSSFQVPDAEPSQAARWQANWWARVWRDGMVEPMPMASLVENWLLDNLPAATELVLVHADYRTGNYLFDEEEKRITAVLDWELAHIGDYHEDLGWTVQRVFGVAADGSFYVTGLFEREEFLDRYEQMSGRKVNRKTLHFYEVVAAYKCLAIILARGMQVSVEALNHQDILMTWLAAAGHIFHSELCRLLEAGSPA